MSPLGGRSVDAVAVRGFFFFAFNEGERSQVRSLWNDGWLVFLIFLFLTAILTLFFAYLYEILLLGCYQTIFEPTKQVENSE